MVIKDDYAKQSHPSTLYQPHPRSKRFFHTAVLLMWQHETI